MQTITRQGHRALRAWLVFGTLVAIGLAVALATRSSPTAQAGLASNPNLDPGTTLSGPAPDFTLTDQFGRRVSLRAFRGKAVVLAFNDSQCTTVCPLTTTAMTEAQALLGRAGSHVQLLGIDANPNATSVSDVRAYSQAHGMLHQWRFLTGSPDHLKHVWAAYHIEVAIQRGQIDHTPALFLIDPQGRLRKLFMTQQNYASVVQLGQLLAQDTAALLPGHPRLGSVRSYAQIPPEGPATPVSLPRVGGGRVQLGTGRGPQLLYFFASWVQQTMDLRAQLATLDAYRTLAAGKGLPAPVAVDEASVDTPAGLRTFLRDLHSTVRVPIALDSSGRVADGYEVQDQPWIVLTSAGGQILWFRDISTDGPLSAAQIARTVRAALAKAPAAPTGGRDGASAALRGSPPALAALHAQAGQLLGGEPALAARLKALRGYPVVLNAWASWCGPCQAEFGLFRSASLRYGRQVAFVGVNANDHSDSALGFLAKHPVSYPSYQMSSSALTAIIPQGVVGLPTTIYIDRSGKVVEVYSDQYDSQGVLDDNIAQYALGH